MMCVAADDKTLTSHHILSVSTNNLAYSPDLVSSPDETYCIGTRFLPNSLAALVNKKGCKIIVALVESIALIAVPVLIVLITSIVLIVGLYKKLCSQSHVVKRSVETVIIMMVGFNCCVLPYCLTVPIDPVVLGGRCMLVLIFLLHLHSAINPLIYLLRSSKFRRQAITIGSEFIRSIDKRHRLKSIRQSFKRRQCD